MTIKRGEKAGQLVLFGLVLIALMTISVSASLTDGLVSYYKLDESSGWGIDSLGLNNATLVGHVNSSIGIINTGRGNFSTTNYLKKSVATGLPLNENSSFSVGGWLYRLTNSTAYDVRIMGLGNTNHSNYMVVGIGLDNGKLSWDITKSNVGGNGITSSYNATIGVWTFMVATYNGTTKNWTAYANGAYYSSTNFTRTGCLSPINLLVGQRFLEDGNSSSILVDEAFLYNRTLNSAEVSSLYNGGAGLSYPFCTPNWSCSGYASCLSNNTQLCNAVTDNNSCGQSYTGNYSEFSPQACDFCTPNWLCSGYGSCSLNDTKSCNAVADNNTCFAQTNLSSDNYSGNYSEFSPTNCYPTTPTDLAVWLYNPTMGYLSYPNVSSESLHWNISITNQSSITYDCRMNDTFEFECGLQPPAQIVYELQWTNDSMTWHDLLPYNYSGCPNCPNTTGGAWGVGVIHLIPYDFSNSNITFRARAFDGFAYSNWDVSDPVLNCKSVWNCTASNTSNCDGFHYQCIEATDISGCGYGNMSSEDLLYYQEVILNKDTCSNCTPNWNCTAFTGCVNGHKNCTGVNDLNSCGQSFTGNLSNYGETCGGYTSQYETGDLSKLTIDTLSRIVLAVLSMVGVIVLIGVVVFMGNKIKKTMR